jgi:hypothetical protein
MNYANSIPEKIDRRDRRSGIDRRRDFIPGYVPERRSNQERRSGQDRRIRKDNGNVSYLGRISDTYMEFANTIKGIFIATLLSLPLWAFIIFLIFIKK